MLYKYNYNMIEKTIRLLFSINEIGVGDVWTRVQSCAKIAG